MQGNGVFDSGLDAASREKLGKKGLRWVLPHISRGAPYQKTRGTPILIHETKMVDGNCGYIANR